MNAPMPSTLQSVPIPGMGVLLSRLPATARAGAQWTQRHFLDAYRRLRTEPLDDELVMEAAESVWLPHQHLALAVFRSLAGDPGLYQAIIEEGLSEADRIITEKLGDDMDGADTLNWVVTWLRSFSRGVVAWMPQTLGAIDEVTADPLFVRELCRAPEGGVFRAMVLLGAAEDAARAGTETQRLADLVDQAFLEMCRGTDALRATMPLWPSYPFQGESPAERGGRAVRYAAAFREAGNAEELDEFRRTLEMGSR